MTRGEVIMFLIGLCAGAAVAGTVVWWILSAIIRDLRRVIRDLETGKGGK